MYLISYDIESDSMRRKISKLLENYGKRIQYSVFECDISDKKFKEVYAKTLKLTGKLENGSVRFYYICGNCMPKALIIGEEKPSVRRTDDVIIILFFLVALHNELLRKGD